MITNKFAYNSDITQNKTILVSHELAFLRHNHCPQTEKQWKQQPKQQDQSHDSVHQSYKNS